MKITTIHKSRCDPEPPDITDHLSDWKFATCYAGSSNIILNFYIGRANQENLPARTPVRTALGLGSSQAKLLIFIDKHSKRKRLVMLPRLNQVEI